MGVVKGLKQLTDPSQFPAWLYGIVRRKCADVIRVSQRNRRLIERAQQQPDPAAAIRHDSGATQTWLIW
ncbi:MAG: hypothetical protein HC872_08655 [Gammaproteobacteria bacterium]|nr:hypothetical protein [Gammaproteobacteria bacterium]